MVKPCQIRTRVFAKQSQEVFCLQLEKWLESQENNEEFPSVERLGHQNLDSTQKSEILVFRGEPADNCQSLAVENKVVAQTSWPNNDESFR